MQRSVAIAQRATKAQPSPAPPGGGGRPSSARGKQTSESFGIEAKSPRA